MKKKIYYYHTDCGGVVYYGRYLEFLEEARTEYFNERGLTLKKLAEGGVIFVVARQEVDYKYPAFYADVLSLKTGVSEVSGAKIIFTNQIHNQNNQLVAEARTILVCVNKSLRPKAIPEEIKSKLL